MEEKTTEALRYIDFITSDPGIVRPILSALSNELQLPILHVTADPTRSGPRNRKNSRNNHNKGNNIMDNTKEDYAIATFALGEADFGRI